MYRNQKKSNSHLLPYRDNTKSLTIFPTLYISYPWLIYSLYLLISLTYFFHPPQAAVCLFSLPVTVSVVCVSVL